MKELRVINIDENLHRAFRVYCAGTDISMSQRLIQCMRELTDTEAEDRQGLAQAFRKGLKRVSEK